VVDDPVAIAWIKRLVADQARKKEKKPIPAPRTQKETIGIVGSGPAGLTAAHDLVKAGYGVTVYEAASEPGGMLTRVIPEFKLSKASVLADIDFIKGLGVEIKTNSPVGGSLKIEGLLKKHRAVLAAVGSWTPTTLKVPGSDLEGVHYALPLLEGIKQGKAISLKGRVMIIGGGNTAMDMARAAVRLGAGEVHVACLETLDQMPAHPWEIESALREGVQIHPALAPQKFRKGPGKRVAGVDFRKVASLHTDKEGNLSWALQEGAGSESSRDADAVIIAIGQAPAVSSLGSKLKMSPRGTLAVDPETMSTEIPGLFAAGDAVAGAGTVVESMAAGRKAAASIIKYLTGSAPKEKETSLAETLQRAGETVNVDFPAQRRRQVMPTLPLKEALSSFDEVELGYREKNGMEEAGRCLNCATVCIKGATIPDVLYHPNRLLYPLKRTGARGEGKWQRISWDEALSTIAAKLKEIKEHSGPEAIHVSCGSGQKHIGIQATKMAERLWPTPNTHLGRYTCIHPDVMANSVTFGDTITYEFGPDYGDARCIVFWGSEPDVATPAQARVVHRALRQGAKLMVIDPRPIPMARRADLWLRLRPGTDMALALSMAHVIINEGLYDRNFVEEYCHGFDRLKAHVQPHTPEWGAEITGLSRRNHQRRPDVRRKPARVRLHPPGVGSAAGDLHPDLPGHFDPDCHHRQRGCPGRKPPLLQDLPGGTHVASVPHVLGGEAPGGHQREEAGGQGVPPHAQARPLPHPHHHQGHGRGKGEGHVVHRRQPDRGGDGQPKGLGHPQEQAGFPLRLGPLHDPHGRAGRHRAPGGLLPGMRPAGGSLRPSLQHGHGLPEGGRTAGRVQR
jgi:NADPH-dependent glutamate synthase beta subunit-like oxidoreductase